jgi:hypothetical protein
MAAPELLNTMEKLDRDAIVIAIHDMSRAESSLINLMPREINHPDWIEWSRRLTGLYFVRLELERMLEAKGNA